MTTDRKVVSYKPHVFRLGQLTIKTVTKNAIKNEKTSIILRLCNNEHLPFCSRCGNLKVV